MQKELGGKFHRGEREEMNWRSSILKSEDAKDLRCKSLTRASVGNYILMSLSNKVSCKLVKPVNLSKRFCICLHFLSMMRIVFA